MHTLVSHTLTAIVRNTCVAAIGAMRFSVCVTSVAHTFYIKERKTMKLKMKKTLALILCLAMLASVFTFTVPVVAADTVYSGTCGANGDNVKWELNATTGVMTISGEGEMADYDYRTLPPWNTYKFSIKTVNINEGVTRIGAYSFRNYYPGLSAVTMPDTVTSVGEQAFFASYGIKSIYIPANLNDIGDAFFALSSLEAITVSKDNKVYHANGNCLIETETKRLVLGCTESIIPNDGSVTVIAERAFARSDIKNIVIPEAVTCVEFRAFEDCGATSISISSGLTNISPRAFDWCINVTEVTVDEANPVYYSNGNCIIDRENKTIVTGFESSVIPADGSVVAIGDYASATSICPACVGWFP